MPLFRRPARGGTDRGWFRRDRDPGVTPPPDRTSRDRSRWRHGGAVTGWGDNGTHGVQGECMPSESGQEPGPLTGRWWRETTDECAGRYPAEVTFAPGTTYLGR